MAGHSKWSQIKRKKGANDAQRGKIFTKIAKAISLAAQEGGGDPDMNFSLRMAVDEAKSANMPADNIERAIKRGTGELQGESKIVDVIYEAYSASAVPVLVQSKTDNTNRSVTEIRNLIENKLGGKFVPAGSVAWQFMEVGMVSLYPEAFVDSGKFGKEGSYQPVDAEEAMLTLMEIDGVEDVVTDTDEENKKVLVVHTNKDKLAQVHQAISSGKYHILSSQLTYIPKDPIRPSAEQISELDNFVEVLYESDEVANVWIGADNSR